jgi:MoxR-like ATPase
MSETNTNAENQAAPGTDTGPPAAASSEARADEFRESFTRIKTEVEKVIVGHQDVIEGVLTTLFAGGHALLEGVPGLGKTLLVRTLGDVLDLGFSRIQFTPDLMPADIIGTTLVVDDGEGGRKFKFQRGPIFAQIVLADEINRATPKTQSAMLEAMQEKSVTVGSTTHKLERPFFVLATQNPIEQEGTYPLPEAQLDRFLVKLVVRPSGREELNEILDRTTRDAMPTPSRVISGDKVRELSGVVRDVVVAPHVRDYVSRIVLASQPTTAGVPDLVQRYVRWGASPRGAQALMLTSKVRALMAGRFNVAFADVAAGVHPCLRHRILLNFEGEAEQISTDQVVDQILESVPREAD